MKNAIEEEIEKLSNIKELYTPLEKGQKSIYYAKKTLVDSELALREKECMRQGLYKKDGVTMDMGKINATAFKSAIAVWDGGEDKMKLLNEEKDEYLSALKKGLIDKEEAKSLIRKQESVKEATSQAKTDKEELKTKASPEIIEALDLLAKDKIVKMKIADAEKEGKTVKKKDNNLPFKIFSLLKKKLGLS